MDILNPDEHIPWITYGAMGWLEKYLNNQMCVFEFGSGGSTLYFASKVKHVVSIEHNEAWYHSVKTALVNRGENVTYKFKPPQFSCLARYLPYHHLAYVSRTFPEHINCFFRSYVRSIKKYPKENFDFVMVDGRARVSCMHLALSKIKPGGYLMLDNSERPIYQAYMQTLNRFERLDFFGNGPRLVEPWQTTVWRIN